MKVLDIDLPLRFLLDCMTTCFGRFAEGIPTNLLLQRIFPYAVRTFASAMSNASSASIEEALAAYKTQIVQSSRSFFSAKISALEQDPALTERQRLDLLAPYFHLSRWPRSGHASHITSPSQILVAPNETNYVDLGLDHDGTIPPASNSAVHTFLGSLTTAINQAAPGQNLTIPDDYRRLLRMTDAISDMDFAQTGDAGLDGTCGGLPARHHLSDMLPDQSQWRADGWTVLGGWQAGIGNLSATQMLFSRKEGGSSEEQELRWRVYAYDSRDFDGRWFSSIAEWLDFKASWLDRLPDGWQSARLGPPEDGSEASSEQAEDSGIEDE